MINPNNKILTCRRLQTRGNDKKKKKRKRERVRIKWKNYIREVFCFLVVFFFLPKQIG